MCANTKPGRGTEELVPVAGYKYPLPTCARAQTSYTVMGQQRVAMMVPSRSAGVEASGTQLSARGA